MKRLGFALIVLFTLLLSGCERNDSKIKMKAYFWTSSSPEERHYLYINGKNKGLLPYSLTVPDENDKHKLLALMMRSGRFKIEVKNREGVSVYKERFTLRLRRNSTTIRTSGDDDRGGSKVQRKGNVLVKEIYFD